MDLLLGVASILYYNLNISQHPGAIRSAGLSFQGAILDEFLEIDTFQGTGVQPGVVLAAFWRSQAVILGHWAVIPLRQALISECSAIILGLARHGGQASPATATGPPRSRLPGLCSCVACGLAISLNSTHVRAHGRQL